MRTCVPLLPLAARRRAVGTQPASAAAAVVAAMRLYTVWLRGRWSHR